MKQGGQALLGGLDCLVARNFFGAQINSFETRMPAPPCLQQYAGNGSPAEPYRAVFIRSAPDDRLRRTAAAVSTLAGRCRHGLHCISHVAARLQGAWDPGVCARP